MEVAKGEERSSVPDLIVWNYAIHSRGPTGLGKALDADRQMPRRRLRFVQVFP